MFRLNTSLWRVFTVILLIGLGASFAAFMYLRSLSTPVPENGQVEVSDGLIELLNAQVQVGDLIFRGRPNSWGDLGARLSDHDQRFGHVGVIVQGAVGAHMFDVIDAAGHPLSKDAAVARGRLDIFLHRAEHVGVYRVTLTPDERAEFLAVLERHAVLATPFDNQFSLTSADALYCTELIRSALMEVTGEDPIEEVTMWRGERVIALDDLQASPIVSGILAWSTTSP